MENDSDVSSLGNNIKLAKSVSEISQQGYSSTLKTSALCSLVFLTSTVVSSLLWYSGILKGKIGMFLTIASGCALAVAGIIFFVQKIGTNSIDRSYNNAERNYKNLVKVKNDIAQNDIDTKKKIYEEKKEHVEKIAPITGSDAADKITNDNTNTRRVKRNPLLSLESIKKEVSLDK